MSTKSNTVLKDVKKTLKGKETPNELARSRSGRFLLRKLILPVGAGLLTALAFHALQNWEEHQQGEPEGEEDPGQAAAKAVWWLPVIRLGSTMLKSYLDQKIQENHPAS